MGGYVRAMRRYVVFQGRATRAEFWQFTAVALGLTFVGLVLDAALPQDLHAGSKKDPAGIFTALILLAHLLPAFAVTVRRLHDTNRSGWMVLLNYIPPLNLIIVILACLRGTQGPNQYGSDPLDPTAASLAITTPGMATGPATTPVMPLPAAPVRTDAIAEIERLGRLRREGHLSEAEFEVMKAEALAQARR